MKPTTKHTTKHTTNLATNWVSRFALLLALVAVSGCGSDSSAPHSDIQANAWPASQMSSRVQRSGAGLVVTNSSGQVIFSQSMPIDEYKLTSQLLVIRYQDQGHRILVINADGRTLSAASGLFEDEREGPAEVKVSDEIVAIQYYSEGPRILALNAAGDYLITPGSLYEKAHLALSNHILGLTYESQGSRVYAVNSHGRMLVSPADLYEDAKIKVDDDRISVRSKNNPPFSVDLNGVPVTARARR